MLEMIKLVPDERWWTRVADMKLTPATHGKGMCRKDKQTVTGQFYDANGTE